MYRTLVQMVDDVEVRNDAGKDEVDFDDIERQWLEVLGCEDGDDDETDDAYVDEEIGGDGVDEVDFDDEFNEDVDDEFEMSNVEEELFELLEDSRIEQTLEDYVFDGTGLFSVSEMDDLKKKERVLNERNQRGYSRCKNKRPKTHEQICNAYQK